MNPAPKRYLRFVRGYTKDVGDFARELLLAHEFGVPEMRCLFLETDEDPDFVMAYELTPELIKDIPLDPWEEIDFGRFDYFLEADDALGLDPGPGDHRVWSEDDCTTGDPDHETLEKAWLRLYGEALPPKETAVFIRDWGDAQFVRYANGRIAVHSFRGNCEIRELT